MRVIFLFIFSEENFTIFLGNIVQSNFMVAQDGSTYVGNPQAKLLMNINVSRFPIPLCIPPLCAMQLFISYSYR